MRPSPTLTKDMLTMHAEDSADDAIIAEQLGHHAVTRSVGKKCEHGGRRSGGALRAGAAGAGGCAWSRWPAAGPLAVPSARIRRARPCRGRSPACLVFSGRWPVEGGAVARGRGPGLPQMPAWGPPGRGRPAGVRGGGWRPRPGVVVGRGAADLSVGSGSARAAVPHGGGRRRRRRGACPGRGGRRGLASLRGLPLAESALRAAAAARPTAGHFQRIFDEMFGAQHVRQQHAPRVPA